jgi:mono/diheme cytochrome c family protein
MRRSGARDAVLALLLAACAGCGFAGRSEGEKLWRKHCADCHGLDGAGNTPRYMGTPGADLRDDAWRFGSDRSSVETVVREGIFGQMPAFDQLTNAEMRAMLDYFYQLRGESE